MAILKSGNIRQKMKRNNQLTFSGCCDTVEIIKGTTKVTFGNHTYQVNVVHCKNCGSVKATSNIKEQKVG